MTTQPTKKELELAVLGERSTAASPQAKAETAAPKHPFFIRTSDRKENELPHPDPSAAEARGIIFESTLRRGGPQPSKDDMEIASGIERVLHALREVYPEDRAGCESRFRRVYVRLFDLARVALEIGGETRMAPEVAKAELNDISGELIDDEAGRVKNGHLRELGRWAARLALPFLALYVVMRLLPAHTQLAHALRALAIDPVMVSNFALLWVGSFVGVCLSYAFRTTEFTLADLTVTDSDHLAPPIRLVLVGALAALLAALCIVGFANVELGGLKLSDIGDRPMLALVVGAVLGISEKGLAGTVAKRAGELFGSAK